MKEINTFSCSTILPAMSGGWLLYGSHGMMLQCTPSTFIDIFSVCHIPSSSLNKPGMSLKVAYNDLVSFLNLPKM